MKVSKFPTPIVEEIYKAIKLNRKAKYSWLQDNLGVSEATIKRAISAIVTGTGIWVYPSTCPSD